MKITLKALTSVLAIASLIIFTGCGGGSDPAPSIQDQQLEKLTAVWSISTVTLDKVDKTADYKTPSVASNFQLNISGTSGATIFGYSTSGRSKTSPWKSGGTWVFGTTPESQIIRDYDPTKADSDAANIDKLPMTYSLSPDGKTLQLSFTFSGPGYAARTSNVSGAWVFTFTKP